MFCYPEGSQKKLSGHELLHQKRIYLQKKKKKMKVAFPNTMLRHFGAAPANTSEKNMTIGG